MEWSSRLKCFAAGFSRHDFLHIWLVAIWSYMKGILHFPQYCFCVYFEHSISYAKFLVLQSITCGPQSEWVSSDCICQYLRYLNTMTGFALESGPSSGSCRACAEFYEIHEMMQQHYTVIMQSGTCFPCSTVGLSSTFGAMFLLCIKECFPQSCNDFRQHNGSTMLLHHFSNFLKFYTSCVRIRATCTATFQLLL